jgi:anti-anti-sigma factor
LLEVTMSVVSLSTLPLRWETEFDRPTGGAHVTARGELDRVTVPILRDQVSWLAATKRTPVVMDLSPITFMDVGGYEFLREAQVLFSDGGLRVFVDKASPAVHRVLDLLGWPIDQYSGEASARSA